MNEKVLHTLEYYKIIDMLSECATSAPGRALCRALLPSCDLSEIRFSQQETTDALARIRTKGQLSFGGTRDVGASLKRLEIGAPLSAPELMHIGELLRNAERAREYGVHPADEDGENPPDCLEGQFRGLDPLPDEARELSRCILGENLIADTASPGLNQVRRRLRTVDERMRNELNACLNQYRSSLMESVITMRNGSYCLAVKSEFKSKIPGVVHDQSSSGSTVFIEPMAAIRINNERRELEIQEQKEIAAVLAALSTRLMPKTAAIEADFTILSHLDFVFAKAKLSGTMSGSQPVFGQDGILEIKDARHPLIPKDKVVPITVRLGDRFDLLIITGPNTGGKTVSLKTVGLFTLMGQAGLHIPAFEGSRLSVFDEVFADIGDEQSIEQSLSTFSGHMRNVVEILDKADSRSLCLFDELGAGTDPTEGAALAISILSFLHGMKTRTVATTHYSELKVYALQTPGVENASCEFDVETLRPTYRLLIGVPGKSNAFAISRKLGLPEYIIDDARTHIERNDAAFEDLLTRLEQDRTTIEKERAEAARYREEIEQLKSRFEKQDEQLDDKRERLLKKAKAEAERILSEAKETADSSIRRINRLTSDAGLLRELEKERTKIREGLKGVESKGGIKAAEKPEKKAKTRPLKLGDSVQVLSMNHTAIVSSLPDKNNRLFVRMGILRTQVSLDDLVLLEDDDSGSGFGAGRGRSGQKGQGGRGGFTAKGFSKAADISPEINLIGKTVDEATAELSKYLDDAILSHLNSVRVIHGRGTGALKKGILAWLKKQSCVKSFKNAEYDDGGDAVTVVTLK